MSLAVVVWDRDDDPPADRPEEVLCWRSYRQANGVHSVPRYLEEHAERMRERYLAFVHDLGEAQFAGACLRDHLDLGDGLSFWWLTQIAEKSPFKSPRIYDCLRLLCLEEMLLQSGAARLTLRSADTALAESLGSMCRRLGVGFRFEAHSARKRLSLRNLYESLPHVVRGALSLRHVLRRWPLRRARPARWFGGEQALFICSYFIHLDPQRCARGEFYSRQWEELPHVVQERGGQLNWLQLFLYSTVVPSVRQGSQWVRRFNANASQQGAHAFADSFLTVNRLLSALRLWLRLVLRARRLRELPEAFYPRGSSAWLWPLLREDWRTSVAGTVALSNCMHVVLFTAALAALPRQRRGLYLCENQGWEKALLHAWRRAGHGEIIGVQHATAPFWHLYYLDDRRSFDRQSGTSLPLPDLLAVNGADALRTLTAAAYPAARLAPVEALRYLQLAQVREAFRRKRRSHDGHTRILILGDIAAQSMQHLLQMLQGACRLLPRSYCFTYKPHPGYAASLADYPDLAARETQDALASILAQHDVAVAANSTSAAVDAFVAGLPVIIALDGDALNLSPLRGRGGARFVGTAEELAEALQVTFGGPNLEEQGDFFFLDERLPRWRHLLQLESAANCAIGPHVAGALSG